MRQQMTAVGSLQEAQCQCSRASAASCSGQYQHGVRGTKCISWGEQHDRREHEDKDPTNRGESKTARGGRHERCKPNGSYGLVSVSMFRTTHCLLRPGQYSSGSGLQQHTQWHIAHGRSSCLGATATTNASIASLSPSGVATVRMTFSARTTDKPSRLPMISSGVKRRAGS